MKKNQTILIITIILFAIAAYFLITTKKGTIRQELKDFAVEDTASITKIFIADKFGHASTVEKISPGKWMVNGKYPARTDAINTLLLTMKNMEVRSPVAKAAYNNIMKELAAKGRKVEIYQNGELSKTYYVGSATQDQLGTFMFLENSSVPFVLFIPGFDGYLTTRYILDENEWKQNLVLNIGIEDIASVTLQDLEEPGNSIMVTRKPDGDFSLATLSDKKPVENTEQNKIQNYMSGFTNLNYEFQTRSSKEYADSVTAGGPFEILTVTDTKNKTTTVKMYRMAVSERSKELFENPSGEKMKYDPDRMFAMINNEPGLFVLQYFVFGKLFKKPADFLAGDSNKSSK